MVVSASLLFPIAFGVPALLVEGPAVCPSAAEVGSELARIMTLPEIAGASDRAVVTASAREVSVALYDPQGTLAGERRLAAEGTCEEQARAVAVVLATWFTDVHPEYRAALPAESPPVAASPSGAAGAEPPVPSASATGAASPPPPPPAPPPAPKAPAPPAGAPFRLSGAFAVGIELSDAGVTPAFELSGRYAPDATGFGALTSALVSLPVTRELGSGSVQSFRWPIGIGPLARLRAGSALVDFAVGPTLAWLHVEGEGFTTNQTDDDVVLGGFAGARVAWGRGLVRTFASAGLLVWFSGAAAEASDPDARLELPRVEGTLLVGVSLDP